MRRGLILAVFVAWAITTIAALLMWPFTGALLVIWLQYVTGRAF